MTTPFEEIEPQHAGFDPAKLTEAIDFAQAHESTMDRDIGAALKAGHFGEPWPIGQTIGPVKDRADPAGLILKEGKLVCHWGDVHRVDMTFSISKSYIALCAGIAVEDGLIKDIDAPVRDLVDDGGFDGPQNADITWRQLLQLTSEWQGTLWDKPDWIDHNRDLSGRPGANDNKGQKRPLQKPGTHWEYNDVRVNRASLALMRVFARPLPEILKERIMDPIGASDTWVWHGYDNSWVTMRGRKMQAVSGGGHWGGGLWINSLDHARVGQLMLNGGLWNGQRLLSEAWVQEVITPCPLNPSYGLMWWLNADLEPLLPAATRSSFFGLGVGSNLLWVEPENQLVVVVRWIDRPALDDFAQKVMTALR
ncbi:MAG: serine hydrolase [Pseudomonadota bacterium]